ncbi:MAG: hypothetical protein CFE44_11415 [Burkholderiales bacterium PBB4]|nr:MAG: hypothetical protein CFE44_11415 [Burkholderiales bacterium PBB4]
MKPQFAFKFAQSSTALKDIHEVRFQGQRPHVLQRQGKPLHAFHTQGMQIVGVPPELVALVGAQTFSALNGGVNFADVGKTPKFFSSEESKVQTDPRHRLITSVHLELPEAIYLLRIENQVYMALPK